MTELIGWSAATVLLTTIGRQVYTQWRDGRSKAYRVGCSSVR